MSATPYLLEKCVVVSLSQVHNTLFFKKYCAVRHARNTIFFLKKSVVASLSQHIIMVALCNRADHYIFAL